MYCRKETVLKMEGKKSEVIGTRKDPQLDIYRSKYTILLLTKILMTNVFLGIPLWKKTTAVSKYQSVTLWFTKLLRASILLNLVTNLCPMYYCPSHFINMETEWVSRGSKWWNPGCLNSSPVLPLLCHAAVLGSWQDSIWGSTAF